ncbi:uncharacterized protein LOC132705242 isoform X2 [Cylas formicarius]|nr:uncharacterized protein LOC132705242 isoform X2 [Cylas formicarius]
MTWKVLRDFEKTMNTNYQNTGEGVVQFNNSLLQPGFKYDLHVMLKDPDGRIEEKQVPLIYPEQNDMPYSDASAASLILEIGTSYVYITSDLIINAKVAICSNLTAYHFEWTFLSQNGSEVIIPLTEKSSQLIILSDVLIAAVQTSATYVVECNVIDAEREVSIANAIVKIKTVEPSKDIWDSFEVRLPFKKTTINMNNPITIKPNIVNPFGREMNYEIEWFCFLESKIICDNQRDSILHLENGFSREGLYDITLNVKNGEVERNDSCQVEVISGVPSIEFHMEYPLKPLNGIEIVAHIDELRTYCAVRWVSGGQYATDLNKIPGFLNEIHNISSMDRLFLEEIEEFGNITISKEFKLKIPPPSKTWPGLQDGVHNVSLTVSCPSIQEINNPAEIIEKPSDFITVSGWTLIEIEPTPILKQLNVSSEDCVATRSIYLFKTSPAVGTRPILYKYGFIFDDFDAVFYTGIDVFSTETILPYNEDRGIQTYVEGCDYLGNCGRMFGPTIITNVENTLDESGFLKIFHQKLEAGDYTKAMIYAVIFTQTSKYQTHSINNTVNRELKEKMESFLGADPKSESWKASAGIFLQSLVQFEAYLEVSTDIIESVILLRDQLSSTEDQRESIGRHLLLTKEKNSHTLKEMKISLELSEFIIANSINRESIEKEKEHIVNTLVAYMEQACANIFKGHKVFQVEMKTLIFAVEKFYVGSKYVTIPFEQNSWNMTAKIKTHWRGNSTGYCSAKTMFRDYFSRNSTTFGFHLVRGLNSPSEEAVDFNVTVFLPTEEPQHNILKCSVYKNGWLSTCRIKKHLNGYVVCSCPSLGYFFLDLDNSTSLNANATLEEYFDNAENVTVNIPEISFNRFDGEKISYVIIASCFGGFVILCYIIRKLTIYPQQNPIFDPTHENVHYGNLLHDEIN